MDDALIQKFISDWQKSGAAERANYALFLTELCDLLGVPHPEPTQPDDTANAYVFERSVTFQHLDGASSTGRIDLYKRGCFILEAKQGVEKRAKDEARDLWLHRQGVAVMRIGAGEVYRDLGGVTDGVIRRAIERIAGR